MTPDVVLYKDSGRTLTFIAEEIPDGLLVTSAILTLKESPDDADSAAKLKLTITASESGSGRITDTGDGDNTAKFSFYIDMNDLDSTSPGTYYMAVKAILSDGGPMIFPNSLKVVQLYGPQIEAET